MEPSQSSKFKELAAGARPSPRVSKKRAVEVVEAALVEDKTAEETAAEATTAEVVVWELDDNSIAAKIAQTEQKKAPAAPKKPKKQGSAEPIVRKKTSIVWPMFKSTKDPSTYECKLHEHAGDNHPRYVLQAAGANSNLLDHARRYCSKANNTYMSCQASRTCC